MLAVLDTVDVLRTHPRFDDQFFLERQDLHDVLAGLDHATLRVIAQLDHNASDRGYNTNSIKYALGAEHSLTDIGQFPTHLMHLFDCGLDRGLPDAVDLLVGARDTLLGISDVAHDAPDFALQIGLRALQHHQLRLANQAGLQKVLLGLDLFIEQHDLPSDRIQLNVRPLNPLIQRVDSLINARNIAVHVVLASREGEPLALQDFPRLGLIRDLREFFREYDLILFPHFGLQSGIDCRQSYAAEEQAAQFGAGRGLIEDHQQLVLLDNIAFAHIDIADDTAFKMLDDLVLSGCD